MSGYSILSRATRIAEDFQEKLKSIRTGRVNASVLDTIMVEAYGTKMHINELATVTSPEPAQLLVTPFDKGVLTSMEKAVRDSNLGVNPVNDGAGLRLNFPPLTEENRKDKVKEVNKLLEEARIHVRTHRTDVLKDEKKLKEASEITEDDLKRFEEDLQKEVDHLNKELEELAKKKQDELMKI